MSDPQKTKLAQRLERGEMVCYGESPFPLPHGDDRTFLLGQSLAGSRHKNISLDPRTRKVVGYQRRSTEQAARLERLLAEFARQAQAWLASVLPSYARLWQPDRASYRPLEEATRRLRLTARNDLLHVDAFPTRPTQGWRILRLFVNLNPCEPRVWATSDTFAKLLARFGREVGLPPAAREPWTRRLGQRVLRFFRPDVPAPTLYDEFMLRLHHFLKTNDEFQQRSSRRIWKFAPGSAWLVMSDGVSYAELRGRYALDHSYFIAPESLALPNEAPAALLEQMCGKSVLRPAA